MNNLRLHRSRLRLESIAGIAVAMLVVSSCDRQALAPSHFRPIHNYPALSVSPDSDPVMGGLSGVAQNVAAALEDSATRFGVMRALKADFAGGLGLDLASCNSNPLVEALLQEGERRGAGSASATCQQLRSRSGFVLYMNADRLRRWDGATVPIVTAIDDMNKPLPPSFHGYRSPTLTIDLPRNGSLRGPILLVLPLPHPRGLAQRAAHMPAVRDVTPIQPPGLPAKDTIRLHR